MRIRMYQLVAFLALYIPFQVSAALVSGNIISAPTSVADDSPGAENTRVEGFNERQGVLLGAPILVNGGAIAAGIRVDSHMIFYNTSGGALTTSSATFTFSGTILGVMSDAGGTMEAATNSILGSVTTFYPGAFGARGLETGDSYTVSGNTLTVTMQVTEPGDWIRVVTVSAVPEPSTWLMFGLGLAGLMYARKRA